MRLTCPNCAAQYEVDDSVVPKGGRDVQCSACGHTWYQYPKGVALDMRAADLDDDDDEDGTPSAVATARSAAPRIDKTVLDVLREEAERELAERRRDRSGIEMQGDLGLTRPTRSKAAPSRIYGEADAPPPPPAPDPDPEPEVTASTPRRRKILPDIEELSSTLEPRGDGKAAVAHDSEQPEADSQGMRRGVTLVALIAAGLVLLYVLAPVIVGWIPASSGVLGAYVDSINALRASAAGALRGVLGG